MVRLQKATLLNLFYFFRLANDEVVRRNALNQDEILWYEHIKWYIQSMKNSERELFVVFDEEHKIGQCRLDVESEKVVISYAVLSKYRGKGYGTQIISALKEYANTRYQGKTLIGIVKKENKPSRKCFEKNEFLCDLEKDIVIYNYKVR